MKLPYSEGSAFLVPLAKGGYARGIVARMAPDGNIMLGYFFGPRLDVDADTKLDELRPGKEILSKRFDYLGLIKGSWPILGKLPDWDRSEWPMPKLVRRDPHGCRKPRLLHYSDTDPSHAVAETMIEEDTSIAADGLAGHIFIQLKLDALL